MPRGQKACQSILIFGPRAAKPTPQLSTNERLLLQIEEGIYDQAFAQLGKTTAASREKLFNNQTTWLSRMTRQLVHESVLPIYKKAEAITSDPDITSEALRADVELMHYDKIKCLLSNEDHANKAEPEFFAKFYQDQLTDNLIKSSFCFSLADRIAKQYQDRGFCVIESELEAQEGEGIYKELQQELSKMKYVDWNRDRLLAGFWRHFFCLALNNKRSYRGKNLKPTIIKAARRYNDSRYHK